MSRNIKTILYNSLVPLAIVSFFVTSSCEENSTEPDETPAIDFKMDTVEGDTLQLSNTLGKIVILQFMHWECDACKAEVPVLNKIYEDYSRSEVEVWAISILHSSPQVLENLKENFINELNPKYPILIDNVRYTKVPVSQAYSVQRTPTTVIIDKEGFIRFWYDETTVPLESFEAWIEQLK